MKNNFQPVQITRFVLSLCCLLCFSVHLFAQQITVSGNVKDSSGEPVIGASVLVKGTTNGVITDFDGNFSIANVEDGSQIEVSYIGYVTQMKKATGTQPLNFILKEDTETLDEVIVVGYGIQKKSVVTASISRVSSDDLKNVTPTRVDNMLKGQTSGVTVTSASGQPGDAAKVRIRGIGTINNSDPLYIVDGMPVDGGIDYLNPSDIESIEVLKDAASAAVYGARAANGVVLVTTKGGSKGKAVISYDFSYGWQNPWRKRDVLNAVEYETLMNEMAVNSGKDAPYANPEAAGEGTDWQDALFNSNAPIMNHQISVSGGSDKGSYFLSTGYFKQDGIVGGNFDRSNYERFTLRMNSNYTLFDQTKNRNWLSSFKIGTNIGYTRIKSVGVDTNNEKGGPLGSALMIAPTLPVYAEDPEAVLKEYPTAIKDKNGNVYTIVGDAYNEITNPLAQLELPGDVNNSDKFVASFWGELQLWDNLKFKTTYGADLAFWGNDGWIYPYYLGKSNSQTQSSAWSGMNRGYTWQLENVLSYDKTFGQHSVSVILGQSAKKYQGRTLWGKNYNLQSLDPDKANINFGQGTKADQEATGQAQPFSTLASMFARVSYNYAERYMFQATIRRDGSSNFGPNNKYAVFPSLSLGWNITNEKFMEKRPEWLTSMKLRASWGKNGNERIVAYGGVAQNRYHNPIIDESLPDPTVIRASDGTFWLYATENIRNLPIYRSTNLVDWSFQGTAFTDNTRPHFVPNGSLWAPDINLIDGKYVLYYSMSTWGGEWTCGIGVATSDSPQGPFEDHGMLFRSNEIGVRNSIDPFYIEDGGKKYLFFGSFHGIYAVELSDDGLSLKENTRPLRVAGDAYEGTYIHKRGKYYYLFASIGRCCEGLKSTYTTVVGRSESLMGPYWNKEGRSMLDNQHEILIKGSTNFVGTGHNSEVITDKKGQDWLFYHAVKVADPEGRVLMLDPLQWKDGWPEVENSIPSDSHDSPVF